MIGQVRFIDKEMAIFSACAFPSNTSLPKDTIQLPAAFELEKSHERTSTSGVCLRTEDQDQRCNEDIIPAGPVNIQLPAAFELEKSHERTSTSGVCLRTEDQGESK
ncbi:unnamed protein product [Peniophora sp. CBMAI 1063]|nr:unnamed protein product [Peniophora sp. CBMAI 1063]